MVEMHKGAVRYALRRVCDSNNNNSVIDVEHMAILTETPDEYNVSFVIEWAILHYNVEV